MKEIFLYLRDRAQEPSTWRALIWAAGGIGITVSPEAETHILTLCMLLAGGIGAGTKG